MERWLSQGFYLSTGTQQPLSPVVVFVDNAEGRAPPSDEMQAKAGRARTALDDEPRRSRILRQAPL
jgi:hypothetical protein